jgi:hypothetical protein
VPSAVRQVQLSAPNGGMHDKISCVFACHFVCHAIPVFHTSGNMLVNMSIKFQVILAGL